MAQKILVIEDDSVIAQTIAAALDAKGHEVVLREQGLQGCEAVRTERPDLILLDVMLPDLDGWEICAMIRTLPDPAVSSIPIIMVTARAREADRLRGLRAGADDYIVKPFSLEELILRVEKQLARAAAERGAPGHPPGPSTLSEAQSLLQHELKNHLVAISGFARRIQERVTDTAPDNLSRYAGFIRNSADHLLSFADDVLLFQKIEEGELDIPTEPVDLQEVVTHVVSLFRPLAEEKNIALHVQKSPLPAARAGETAARICISHLLDNALKYTPAGGAVTVEIGASNGALFLAVEDTGPGVPPEEAERIFDKFYRGEHTAGASKGTGLGLYLVRRLAESFDGRLEYAPRESGGACFRLWFEKMKD